MSVFFVCLTLCGCSVNQSKAVEGATEYLNKNYDDTFTFKTISLGRQRDKRKLPMDFYSENYNREFEVIAESGLFGTKFKDNYYHLYMEDALAEYFAGLTGQLNYPEIKVKYVDGWSEKTTSVDEILAWLRNGTCTANIFFIRNEELEEDSFDKIEAIMEENGFTGNVYFFQAADGDCLRSYSVDTIMENSAEYVLDLKQIVMDKGVVTDEWR